MDPNLGLLAASGLVSFLLKTIAEWLVCLLLVRITRSEKIRFGIWLTMLLGFVAQWLWMGIGIVRAAYLYAPSAALLHAEVPAGGGAAIGSGARVAVATGIAANVARALAVLLVCYVSMLAWRMVGMVAARVRLMRAMRLKTAPGPRLATYFQQALEQTSSAGSRFRDCELWVLPGLASPATLGWWQPRVIVPPVCETQDEEELEVVFWHELKHVERRDALWNAVVRACGNLLWFHPCVHHAIGALNAQRELACDAAVVREHPQSRDVYASCLVRFARYRDLATEPYPAGIEMASSATLLTTRVQSILSEPEGASQISRALRAFVSVVLMGTMAATVPGLNILFAAELSLPAVGLPISLLAPVAGQRRTMKSAGMKIRSAVSSVPTLVAGESRMTPGGLPHDEGLAAEHRAAMDILTESTGMDVPAAGSEGRLSRGVSGPAPGHGSASRTSPAWTSVAVDAAERMGPMMSGRGGDDHH